MVAMKKNLLNQTFSANADARLKPTSKEETKEMKRELKTGPKRRRRRKRGYQRVCYYHYYKFSMKALSRLCTMHLGAERIYSRATRFLDPSFTAISPFSFHRFEDLYKT